MAENVQEKYIVPSKKKRPIEFTTVLFLTIAFAIGLGLTIHFLLLSSETYNWL